jgi:hypothetical protein
VSLYSYPHADQQGITRRTTATRLPNERPW